MRTSTTLHILLITALLSITACNSEQTNNAENMADSVAAKVDTMAQNVKQEAQEAVNDVKEAINGDPDSNFVVDAAIDNMAEMKVLQAGLDKGTDKDLKAHAKMMMADHKKLGITVKAWSVKKGYKLPDGDNGKGDDMLSEINKNSKGIDWDRSWTDHMVKAHDKAINLFEKGQNNVKDPDLKAFITNTLPTLHSHLDMMKQLQDKLGK